MAERNGFKSRSMPDQVLSSDLLLHGVQRFAIRDAYSGPRSVLSRFASDDKLDAECNAEVLFISARYHDAGYCSQPETVG